VEALIKENKPVISEIAALSEVTGTKPTFVFVGELNDEIKKVASEKKAYVDFYSIKVLEGTAEGTLALIENGAVTSGTTSA
jgi:hypothetical protein